MAQDQPTQNEDITQKTYKSERGPWAYIVRGLWRSNLGLLGMVITTVCATLMIIGVAAEFLGLLHNPYAGIFIFLIFPMGMVTGLLLIPIAAFLRRRQWKKRNVLRQHLQINLSNHKHRLFIVGFIVLSVVNITILSMIGYEGYHFTESNSFCGLVCHQVMAPEFTAYQRSPHSRVDCVNCHIGSGADYFIHAKVSGLRQVAAVILGNYRKPIHTPVEGLRLSQDTCEDCHRSDRFVGKKLKVFNHFSNDNQLEPEKTNVTLRVGGLNPKTDAFEGIHWHVRKDIQISFLAADDKRTSIARVRVKQADGSIDEYVNDALAVPTDKENNWRTMECVDCHNRPAHVYQSAEEVVDFGLLSRKINPELVGIREDGLKAIQREYASREEAQSKLVDYLAELQTERSQELAQTYEKDILLAGNYLLKQYLGNVWPNMKIKWGTYKSHIGHQNETEGYGCFRCHDDQHDTQDGKSISQDCDLCHNDPS